MCEQAKRYHFPTSDVASVARLSGACPGWMSLRTARSAVVQPVASTVNLTTTVVAVGHPKPSPASATAAPPSSGNDWLYFAPGLSRPCAITLVRICHGDHFCHRSLRAISRTSQARSTSSRKVSGKSMAKNLHLCRTQPVSGRKRSSSEAPTATKASRRIDRRTEETPTLPLPRVDRPTEETPTLSRAGRPSEEMRTVALTPVEIDAILQGADVTTPAPGAAAAPTLENVRIALGSSPLSPTRAPATPDERGPRRPRETLRADKIRRDPDEPAPPSRKR